MHVFGCLVEISACLEVICPRTIGNGSKGYRQWKQKLSALKVKIVGNESKEIA
jgi:hypothetical protein